jgi:hypothetical protein
MNRPLRSAILVSVNAMAVLGLLEGALRARPDVIPMAALVGFQPTIRNEIAGRRGLTQLASMQPVPRDDGGPWLGVYAPSQTVNFPNTYPGAAHHVAMDRRGFCNPENAAPSGHSDIVTIGDSFTFCTAVKSDTTWTAQLARRTGKKAYDLGRMGLGIHEYVQLLVRYGLALSPSTVIMNVYEGNDLRDAQRFVDFRLSDRRGRRARSKLARKQESWLLNQSYVAATAASLAGHVYVHDLDPRDDRFMRKLRWRYKDPDFQYKLRFADGNVRFNPDNADADELRFALGLGEKRVRTDAWDAMRSGLRRFVELGREHRFKPVVSYTPSAYTAYASVVQFDDPALPPVMQHFSAIQRDFYRKEAPKLGYQFVDLTPALQERAGKLGKSPLLYRPDDLHLTQQGHAAIAETLAGQIQSW